MPQRPQGDALFDSLAKVAEAYGGSADVGRLASVLSSLDLKAIPPELAMAVAETLTYVYALDQSAEGRGIATVPVVEATKGSWLGAIGASALFRGRNGESQGR